MCGSVLEKRTAETIEQASLGRRLSNAAREIVQPFIDFARAPRALWGVNIGYFLEGFVYFGMVTYLAMFFNEYVGLGDIAAGQMVGVLTAGITIAMFLFGGFADRWGVRKALLLAFVLLLIGRVIITGGPTIGLGPGGWGSPVHLVSMLGILVIVVGYGMYQPAAYAAVRQFTNAKTAGMAYAMLYALMNLGGWLPTFFAPIRRSIGIDGAFWVYVGFTALGLILTWLILTRRTVEEAIARVRSSIPKVKVNGEGLIAEDLRCLNCEYNLRTIPADSRCPECGHEVRQTINAREKQGAPPPKEPISISRWFWEHPLWDAKFSFFIFALIPVQTLFAHNWLTLPMYVERAYRGSWIGKNFEVASNFNPLLIFILVPLVAALTQRRRVYNMMIVGTIVMGAPTFLLAIGPSFWTLLGYLVIMTIGEAMWQPRFLQYAAEIAPEGRTAAYMGVAQFPWFMTKMIVPLYSGWFLQRYCPADGPVDTEPMWLIYGCIAMMSPVALLLARGWVGKDFKERS